MDIVRAFLPKIRALFKKFFIKGRGDLTPSPPLVTRLLPETNQKTRGVLMLLGDIDK